MTYTKEARAEEMEQEMLEDKIREMSSEFDDGSMETWIGENKEDLVKSFIEDSEEEFLDFCRMLEHEFIDRNENEFNDYCKERWNEANE